MSTLHILYIGPISGTCLDRANAFRRLGHQVTHLDPRLLLPKTVWIDRIMWRAGGQWFGPLLANAFSKQLQGQRFDLCHVDNGEWISPPVIKVLKERCPKVINYNIDDPTGPRDQQRFAAYRRAVPFYDLLAVVREENVSELKSLGAKHVVRVYRSADERAHAPRVLTEQDISNWACEVLFLGTWMPERGSFLLKLIQLGVPLSIRGANWHKAPEWDSLRSFWKGGPIQGDEYAKAIQCARINLGLLSKGNRDLHTTRSLEIPALGGLFCAERTVEHEGMYRDNVEAIYWSSAEECAHLCKELLANEPRRHAMATNGHERYLKDGFQNENILSNLIEAIVRDKASHA